MLAGVPGVKPDRMILRFVGEATRSAPSPARAAELVTQAAVELGVDPRMLDHRIWQVQSGRG